MPGSSARNRRPRPRWSSAVQRHPDVAVGQHTHRLQHVAGPQRRRGAGRAGRDGEAAPVQRVQQRLAVDVEAGEGDQVRQPVAPGRRPPRRPARSPPPRSRIRSTSAAQPGRLGRRVGRRRPAAAAAAATTAGRSTRRVRARLRARRPATATPSACPCGPPARRPRAGRPTCGRWRVSTDQPAGTGTRPTDWAASTQQRHARPRRRPRRPRRPAAPCRPRGWR